MRHQLPWFRSLVCSNRNNRRTTAKLPSLSVNSLGMPIWCSGSSGFVAGFHVRGGAFYGNAAVAVAFAVAALSVGIDAVDEFAVFIETVHFRPSQCVGNDGMVFAVVERPFFAEVVAALEHFAVGVVTVVFVAGHQSVGLAVFDHDVVAVGETAQFFAVASVNGGQIAVAKIDFGKQQPCAAFG